MGRQAAGRTVLTERDCELVEWVGRYGVAGLEHLMERFGLGRSQCYRRVGGLVCDGMLERLRVLHGEPGLLLATRRGLRWRGLGHLGLAGVTPGLVTHARAVATVAVTLELRLPRCVVMSERELRWAEREAGEPIGSAVAGQLQGGVGQLHRPDLLVITPDGLRVAIEVELSVKGADRLAAICRGWARSRCVDQVWYFAAAGPARAVERAVRSVRAQDRVRVFPVDGLDVVGELAAVNGDRR